MNVSALGGRWLGGIEMRIVQRSLVLALFGADFAYGKTTFDNSLYEQIIRRKDV